MKRTLLLIALFLSLSSLRNEAGAFMFWNQACRFNGGADSSHVSVPHSGTLNISGSFTIEAWVNPTNPPSQIILQKRVGNNNNGYTLFLNAGKVTIRTNSTMRLVGKTVIPKNQWTHIAGTYDSSTNLFTVYINGNADTAVTIAAAAPTPNIDSIFIGKGTGGSFEGQMDEVRLWNRALSTGEIKGNMRTSLGTNSGIYNGLVMSLTFQDKESIGTDFVLTDWSGNNNNGLNRGVTAVDLGNRPSATILLNDCIDLNGTGSDDYVAGPDNADVSPTTGITLEAWIYPRNVSVANRTIIHKGNPTGTNTNYRLRLDNNMITAAVNMNNSFSSNSTIQANIWSHVAFTYNGTTGVYKFYINGELTNSGTNAVGNITDGSDSLYIGGTVNLPDFNGLIDEVRISNYVKTQLQVNKYLYQSVDKSNKINPLGTEVAYNLDGYAVDNCESGPRLYFRNECNFEVWVQQLISPINRSDNLNFQDGYYIKQPRKSIGPTGLTKDTIDLFYDAAITDLNLFVAIEHEDESNLEISLISPDGVEVFVFDNNTLATNLNNVVTIFDDQSDSSLVDGRYVSFGPSIKPVTNMNSSFSGDSSGGKWILKIDDQTGAESGRLYAWGLQVNNMTVKIPCLKLSVIFQGMFSPSSITDDFDQIRRDNGTVTLRESGDHQQEAGQQTAAIDNNITADSEGDKSGGYFPFSTFDENRLGQDLIFDVTNFRTIQTYSSLLQPIRFDFLNPNAEYDMTTVITSAHGSNMILVQAQPVRYAIYSGDVNQDGTIDISDIGQVYNMLNVTGSNIAEDVNGDEFVDGSDALIVDNNAINFVTVIAP